MRSAKVLVVEDDRVVARDIQQQLNRIGHQAVGTIHRGDDAVAYVQEHRPDLVLMDIRLEGQIDGIDAAQQIRDRCQSPVIFLTAYADDETVERASLTEPFGYLLKPFEDSQLRTAIEIALHKHAAESKLRESERRYATTLSSIGDAVIATDKDARVTFINPIAAAMTGWMHDEAVGRPITEVFRLISERLREVVEDPVSTALRLGATVALPDGTILMTRSGAEIPIGDCSAPIIDDRGHVSGAVLVFRDLTDRHRAEEALRRARDDLARAGRLSVMGELTITIAHEVRQPLMAIVTNAATCWRWLSDDRLDIEQARLAAERVIRDGHRAGEILSSVRALAEKSPALMAEFDLNEAISEVLSLLRSEFRRNNVIAKTNFSDEKASCVADRVQIQQVVLNLLMNGIDALCQTERLPRSLRITTHGNLSGYLEIAIADTGIGIDPAIADRIFDAFFTSKDGGVGVGLSICRSVVEAHGGRLWASINIPHGTIFHFTIPAARRELSISL
jgi:PAS domain S-box-containing protein